MDAVSQTLAALAELLIPHYVSASIFAIANKLDIGIFHNNVKLLAVSCPCSPIPYMSCIVLLYRASTSLAQGSTLLFMCYARSFSVVRRMKADRSPCTRKSE